MNKITFVLLLVALFAITTAHPQVTVVDNPNGVHVTDNNPAINCTKPHETYIDCPASLCYPKNCDDLGKSVACASIMAPCPGGCICEKGYLRNSEGMCVKPENCRHVNVVDGQNPGHVNVVDGEQKGPEARS